MEGLGVGSHGELWPCLATDTRANRDRIVLVLRDAPRETRTDAFEFVSEVCLSAALARSYFFDSCGLPQTTTGSLPASWRDGQPAQFSLAASARRLRVGKGGGLACWFGLKKRGRVEASRACFEWKCANLSAKALGALEFRATL